MNDATSPLQRQFQVPLIGTTLLLRPVEHHVLFEIGANNRRSRRAIEKLGATLVDEQILDGNPHVVYRIDKISYPLA